MKRKLVRYKVKQDRAAENEQLIRYVFEELKSASPEGIRYTSFKLEDGVSFVHLASIETDSGDNPLIEIEAFNAFTSDIKDRCEEPPVVEVLEEVGAYRLFEKRSVQG